MLDFVSTETFDHCSAPPATGGRAGRGVDLVLGASLVDDAIAGSPG
jgi:hypothetical protein